MRRRHVSAAFPLGRVVPAEGGRAGRGAGAGGPASPAGAGAGPLRRAGIAAPGGSRGRTAAGRGLSRARGGAGRDGARRGVGPAAGRVLGAPARCWPARGGAAGREGRARRGKEAQTRGAGSVCGSGGCPCRCLGSCSPRPAPGASTWRGVRPTEGCAYVRGVPALWPGGDSVH